MQLDETFRVGGGSLPECVWLLRDTLALPVLARGETPVPYTVLPERSRATESQWYPLQTPPKVRQPYQY